MTRDDALSLERLEKLTCTEELYLGGMIRNLSVPQFSLIHRTSEEPTIGDLDSLPPELLLLILNLLDLQSLIRLSQTCLRVKVIIEALPLYSEIRKHTPDVLVALGRTRMLRYHSVALLSQVLRSNECVSCLNSGFFIFLPTCERICLHCLHFNDAFRMTTLSHAKRCFKLSDRQLRGMPIFYSIPGTYNVMFNISRKRVYRLVNVKQLKLLAIKVHGSAENASRLMPMTRPEDMSVKDFWNFKWFHEAPVGHAVYDPMPKLRISKTVEDEFCGMASLRLPVLGQDGIDRGRLCKGCRLAYELHREGSLPVAALNKLTLPGVFPEDVLFASINTLHSRQDFLRHVKTCYGAERLLKDGKS